MCMPTYFEASLQLSNNDQSTGALYLYDVQDTVLIKTKKIRYYGRQKTRHKERVLHNNNPNN